MGRLFDYDNKVMQSLGKLADIIIIGILWVVLSLTIIGFGPACTAAYYATAKCVRHDRGIVFKEFWSALKNNFWTSMLLGLLLFCFATSLFLFDFAEIANAVLNHQSMETWDILFSVIKLFLFFGLLLYSFPIQSRFQSKNIRIVFSSVLLMFRHIGSTFVMIVTLLAGVVICIFCPYLSLVVPGIVFYFVSFPMERLLLHLIVEEDLEEDEKKDQWYLEQSRE